jgi:hypothetical protein
MRMPFFNYSTGLALMAVSAFALLAACETLPTPEQLDAQDYEIARRTDREPLYQNYLRLHPTGDYAVQAQQRIAQLTIEAASAYQEAARLDTVESYEFALKKYDWAPQAKTARSRYEALQVIRYAEQDKAMWSKVSKANTEEGYEDYLKQFTRGAYVADAEKRRMAMAEVREANEEKAAWNIARKDDDIEGYEHYLADWPDGPNAGRARARLRARPSASYLSR